MSKEIDLLSFTESAADRLKEIEKRLSEPDIVGSPEYASVLREHGAYSKLASIRKQVIDVRERIQEDKELLKEEDEDIAALAKEELPELEKLHDKLMADLEERLLLGDSDSERNCIFEIRAGTGGEEAALFAGDLFRMYARYAEANGWKIEVMEAHASGKDGYKEITFSIQGSAVFSRLRYEGGGHRVQRVPTTESQGRIHTSAATVAVLPEVDDVEIEVNTNDLRIDTYSASGPGGQHVNRTASAVRITHLPSGLVVACQEERSQHKNKARAMRILRSKLYDIAQSAVNKERSEARKAMIGSGDRSDRIRTYNFPQNRVSDHRAEVTLYSLDRIMQGELDILVNAMIEYDKRLRLEELAKDPSLLARK